MKDRVCLTAVGFIRERRSALRRCFVEELRSVCTLTTSHWGKSSSKVAARVQVTGALNGVSGRKRS
jgi:hypothetical protein